MEDREKLVRDKIAEKEKIEGMLYRGVKYYIYDLLTRDKGFHPGEILADPRFSLTLSTGDAIVSIDFLVSIEGNNFMIIHCVSSGIEPWERYILACARAIADYQIPYAVVTDGNTAKLFDIYNNSSSLLSVDDLFTRHEAVALLKNFHRVPCPEKSIEKERRIIYAFEGIKCQPVQLDEG